MTKSKNTPFACAWLGALLLVLAIGLAAAAPAATQGAKAVLSEYLPAVPAGELVAGATAYGPMRDDIPVVPVLKAGDVIGYAFVTSDFVGTTGYSGKPIHVLAAIAPDGKLLRTELVEHSEPIVLIGIPDRKIKALTESYAGLDIVAEAAAGGSAHDLDIISGATVTIMVIDDSVVRSAIKVARALGLGGLAPETASAGPQYVLDMGQTDVEDWQTLSGDGSTRRLSLDVKQINSAFEKTGDQRAVKHPEPGDPDDTYIDLHAALVSAPSIGRSLLGDAEYKNMADWLKEGEQAILLAGRGRYSFKGSGYVRGGIFDRIQLIQGDNSVRFHDRLHRRLGAVAADGAPSFKEVDLFKIPANAGFDPTKPWRVQLLANRAVGPVDKAFLTFDLGYRLPERYRVAVTPPASVTAGAAVGANANRGCP